MVSMMMMMMMMPLSGKNLQNLLEIYRKVTDGSEENSKYNPKEHKIMSKAVDSVSFHSADVTGLIFLHPATFIRRTKLNSAPQLDLDG
jgi:hypothetical protein